MSKVLIEKTGRIGRITLNRPDVMNAIEAMGLPNTQRLATLLGGIIRRSPKGINYKERSEAVGWKQAVDERDRGTYDWTEDRPINGPR